MIVLDLGAHDGFVGYWLKQQDDVDVDLYGVELHPRGVEDCLRRGYKSVKQGIAEDAPTLLPDLVGRCDAVLLFEIIEHVPDVDRLLAAAERMLAPNGVVYVSTPDGTFGLGNNPHHLRALRSIDLADVLRRRGDLTDMEVGRDTVTSAAYRPRPRLGDIAIYCGPGYDRWSPTDVDARGLGGSETWAVKLAEELDRLGHVVTVYGEVEQCAWGPGVIFRHHSTFDPFELREVLISSRIPEVFDRPVRARTTFLWAHDTDFGDRLTPARLRHVDHLVTLSGWHTAHMAGMYPFAVARLRQLRNGIDLARFQGDAGQRRRRVLYTSSPDRGLDLLLGMWPLVRERVPDAELQACYSPVYRKFAEIDAKVGEHAARVEELADQPGVTLLPSQGQADLAKLMRESMVWCAPSYNTPWQQPFQETSCIGAMEAQAAGLHVVASNWGALPETVRVGALVDGPPLSHGWRAAFISEMVRGLVDEQTILRAAVEAPAAVADMHWRGVAEQVAALAG